MHRADKFKTFIAIAIVSAVFISFFIFGKPVAKWVAAGGGIIWLVALMFIRKDNV
tara:strand:+ start:2908 stop:3072 length:165 start_codon:yes stop_codon:yes gene_type:complete